MENSSPTLPSYDLVPYESMPAPACHPDRLYTMAHLFGLSPQPIDRSRILELGCADGGNIIPLALNLPQSQFVGLDLSHRQIDLGRENLQDLNCSNVIMEHASIMDVDEAFGRYDYIICHGVYSWVPPEVQSKILEIFTTNLMPQGIAYLDYNTYPGWSGPQIIRQLMQYHTQGLEDPSQCVAQALAIVDFMAQFIQTEDRDFAQFIKKEIKRLTKVGTRMGGGAYVYHEYLEDTNTPVYFNQLAGQAAEHGLQYLGEAGYANMLTNGFPPQVAETLSGVSRDIVALEQYMDFLRNRRFRQSLFCRQGLNVDREIKPQDIDGLLVACTIGVNPELIDMAPGSTLGRTALTILLEQRPRAIPFEELLVEAIRRSVLGTDRQAGGEQRLALARDLTLYYPLNMIQFLSWQADFTLKPGNRPRLCAMAAHQTRKGQYWLTNQCHEPAILAQPLMIYLPLLDGAHQREDLLAELRKEAAAGSMTMTADPGEPSRPASDLTDRDLEKILEQILSQIAVKALLVE